MDAEGHVRGSWSGRTYNIDIRNVIVRARYSNAQEVMIGFREALVRAVEQSELSALVASMPFAIGEQELFHTGPIVLDADRGTAAGVAKALVAYIVGQLKSLVRFSVMNQTAVFPGSVFNPHAAVLPLAGGAASGSARGMVGKEPQFQHVGGSRVDLDALTPGVPARTSEERKEEERRRQEEKVRADMRRIFEEYEQGSQVFEGFCSRLTQGVYGTALGAARLVNGMLSAFLTGGRVYKDDYRFYLETLRYIASLQLPDDFRKAFEKAMRDVSHAKTPYEFGAALADLVMMTTAIFAPQMAARPVKPSGKIPGLTIEKAPGDAPGGKPPVLALPPGTTKPSAPVIPPTPVLPAAWGGFPIVIKDSTPRLIGGVKVYDKFTQKTYRGTVDLGPTFDRIKAGVAHPHANDGTIFRNAADNLGKIPLPDKPIGYYREFVVPSPTPGVGPQRLVFGKNGEIYYTPDHYHNFTQIQ